MRVAGLHELIARDLEPSAPDAMNATTLAAAISDNAHRLIDEQYKTLNNTLLPALEAKAFASSSAQSGPLLSENGSKITF